MIQAAKQAEAHAISCCGAIGSGLGDYLLDAFDGFTLQNLILLMGAPIPAFGINWFVNGVWGTRKVAAPAAIE